MIWSESLASILVVIFAFVLIKNAMEGRQKAAANRLRVLEEALRVGADKATVEAITQQVDGRRAPPPPPPPPPAPRGSRFLALLLALGWLTMFTGIGVWVLGQMTRSGDAKSAGVLVSIIGLGLVTYPFALKELEARRPGRT